MSSTSQKSIFKIGDVLNNTYKIEAALGRGGTSEVYRARSEISGRVMAVKALRSEFSHNEDYLALMTREEDMREIRHDAIVRYYDNQRTDDGHIYLVMDYIEGPGLDKKLKDGGMSADDLMIVAERVTEGLAAAHAKKIVHRDLSPDNIILRNDNPADAVIIDFGIAKDTNSNAETIIGNEFAGKYAYAAPEQLSGQTDERADIYALGALLLATFRGKSPDIGDNPMEVIQKKGEPLDVHGVPEPLKSLIEKMTQPDRENRLQNATSVLGLIRNGGMDLDNDKTVIVPRSRRAAVEHVPNIGAKDSQPKQKTEITNRQSNKLLPIFGFLALIGVGAVVYFSGLLDGPKLPITEEDIALKQEEPKIAVVDDTPLPIADPYTLIAERKSDGGIHAIGYVPSAKVQTALNTIINAQGGIAELSLAKGEISETWGDDIVQLFEVVNDLDQWRILVDGNKVRVTGVTNDLEIQQRVSTSLAGSGMPSGFVGSSEIKLIPQILTHDLLLPILKKYADCGDLKLVDAPAIGYPDGAQIAISGRFAEVSSRIGLIDAIDAISGDRNLVIDAEVLNPTLCLIDAALPNAPTGYMDITFGFGEKTEENITGRYFIGENPIIDVTIPADLTSGFLFVSALDVSGNVFHLLPNVFDEKNNVESLRNGVSGPMTFRVAHSVDSAADGTKLAFVIDDTSLGKTKVLVIHSDNQIFEGLRPITESAGGYIDALEASTGIINSLDSRILTSVKKP
jgi:serine/threonine-protein kinase